VTPAGLLLLALTAWFLASVAATGLYVVIIATVRTLTRGDRR